MSPSRFAPSRSALARILRAALVPLGCLLWLLPGPAVAASFSLSRDLDFAASGRSLWGPGGSAGSFARDGSAGIRVLGVDVGGEYAFGADAGTVSASVGGNLTVSADDTLARRGTARIELGYDAQRGRFASALEAYVNVNGFVRDVPIFGPWEPCVYCQDWSLNASDTDSLFFDLGDTLVANDDFSVAGVGPEVPGLFGPLASLQLNLNATQSSRFTPESIAGTMQARHRATGALRRVGFDLVDTSFLDIELDLAGHWDFSFLGLDLENTVNTTIGAGLSLDAFVAGLFDRRVNFGSVPLLSTGDYGIDFADRSVSNWFTITVPEAGTGMLLVAGLCGLFAFGLPRPAPVAKR